VISFIITIVVAFITFDSYIDGKIDDRITDDNYVQGLSKALRPFLVFDEFGIVQYDHGATSFVDSIRVHKANTKVHSITVYAKHYLSAAPLLNNIGADRFAYNEPILSFRSGASTPFGQVSLGVRAEIE
jgi:hypothetical protein